MCGVLHRSPVGSESVHCEVSGSISHGSRQLRRLIHVDVVNENLTVRIEADKHAVGVGIDRVVVKLERELAPLALRRNEVLVVCGLVILVLSLLPESDVQACVVLIVRAESLRANLNHVCSCVCANDGIELRSVLVRIDKCASSASQMYAVARPSCCVEVACRNIAVLAVDGSRGRILATLREKTKVLAYVRGLRSGSKRDSHRHNGSDSKCLDCSRNVHKHLKMNDLKSFYFLSII